MSPALQIAIPQASVATPPDGKPFTLYHIQLQLPLRTHEVKKRYTDFLKLHDALASQTGQTPPAPLPAKSWIRRTVNNESLTEQRRQGLEKYLTSIIQSDDARWRSSAAWRAFLNLPGGTNTVNANGSHSASKRPTSAGGITDPNEWLDEHRSLKSQIQRARSQLKQREAATTAQEQHSMSAEAKASLVRAATSITRLEDGLRSIADAKKGREAGWGAGTTLGDGEIRRRRDLLSAAKKEVEGLEGVLKTMATRHANATSATSTAAATTRDTDALWKGTSVGAAKPSGRVLGGGAAAKETAQTRELDNAGVLQLQQQIMQEQDEDVMTLGKTIVKLRDMGIMMNEELAVQNEMLGVLEGDTDRVQSKIDVAKRRIGTIK